MSLKRWCVAAMCGAVLTWPAAAQDSTPDTQPPEGQETPKPAPPETKPEAAKEKRRFEEPPLHRWGGLSVSAMVWRPPISGAESEVATRFRGTDQGLNSVFTDPNQGSVSDAYRATWFLPHQSGAIDFGYDAIKNESSLERLDPGTFLYGETLVLHDFAGLQDNGFADGFRSTSSSKTRRFRVEFAHTAFESPRVKGTWHAGIHFLGQSRDVRATYFSIAPDLPPLLPPSSASAAGLRPRPDFAQSQSDFSGNGVGGGLDVRFHVHPRIDIVGGFSVGLVPGQQKTQYRSLTHFYFFSDAASGQAFIPTFSELVTLLGNDTTAAELVQLNAAASLIERDSNQIAQDYETYLGIEARVWKTLRLFVHLRDIEVVNATAELRPTSVAFAVVGTGYAYAITGFDRTSRSVGYQGIVAGLSYRF